MSKTVTVMTYNVHSAIGMDGTLSPGRIAEVINQCNPDIVALQELDCGVPRTEMIDQAHLIALNLNMSYHFHSSIQVQGGAYGNAILSHYPARMIKAGPLPTQIYNESCERRGAIWVAIDLGGSQLQVMATHFGLNRKERMAQTEELLGPEWLGHADCHEPVVLCGDFNALPASRAYRRITDSLRDVQRCLKGRRPLGTCPVRFPFMRIDHLFISNGLKVRSFTVPKTPLTRMASDHFPLVVTLELT
ncbi:endonuclease/exonuclease/phosphatase family protein [Pelotalea chapellei]|uniref:Endonuclease/exonuclease/phosphatase family protein n=1 Tax=Pelotalea chapellei TaxID=44671 RepID=A0ABS5UCK8_9BACT|nr:endonuclease/exonuclease/phosphatase family protein [Pelotalea chapellei]MBT1073421.1 endonuclease/exonuclease/phosphatase family protein [Pelotalea chapellei]